MNPVTIREMKASETPLLIEWLYVHKDVNQVDFEHFRRNQVKVYVAEDSHGIICFIPIRLVYMFDAIAPQPNLETNKFALVCKAMMEELENVAKEMNVPEVWVQPSDDKFSMFLKKHFGFIKVTRNTLVKSFNEPQESAKCV